MSELKVQIKGKHPHTGEFGTITVEDDKTIKLNWLHMALVKLDNCPHGTDSCFAQKSNLRVVR